MKASQKKVEFWQLFLKILHTRWFHEMPMLLKYTERIKEQKLLEYTQGRNQGGG